MKRKIISLTVGAAALLMALLPSEVSAELRRVPDAPVATANVERQSPEALAAFHHFIQRRAQASEGKLSAEPTSFLTGRAISQKPANPLRSPEAPVGGLYALVPTHQESGEYSAAYFGTLDPSTGRLSKMHSGIVYSNYENYYYECAAMRNGVLYIPNYAEDMVTGQITITWKAVDVATGNRLDDIQFGTNNDAMRAFFYGMTYDEEGDVFYGLALDLQSGNGGILVKVDASKPTWTPELIGDVGGVDNDFMCNIAFNPIDRMLYGLKDTGTMYMIDPEVCDVIEMKQFDDFNEYFCYPESYSTNPMCYSPYDHAFLYVYRDSFEQKMKLISIDADTYDAYEINEITPIGYVAALICNDPYADDDAPDRMEAPVVNFTGASLTGTYSLVAPTQTFAGIQLTQNVRVYVEIDGEEYSDFLMKPGEDTVAEINLTQGEHTLAAYATLGDKKGPKNSVTFYVGHDNPMAPTGLQLNGSRLTWTAPVAGGAHGGYVDASAITYDVYFNGVKQNLTPITNTSFRFAQPEDVARKQITVTATANEMTSAPSVPLSRVIGQALSLPFSIQPATSAEAELFETYNANGDDNVFEYYTDWKDYNCYTIRTGYYYEMPDDWLFLPAVELDDTDALYTLAFDYANAYMNANHLDNLDIYLGSAPEPSKMTQLIYSHEGRSTAAVTRINVPFAVEEDGDYVIGFHAKKGDQTKYRGVQLFNFLVEKKAGANSNVPAEPTDLVVKGAPQGDLSFDITLKMPTKDILGKPLANVPVSVKAATSVDEVEVSALPGEAATLNVAVGEDGFNEVLLSFSNANGPGREVYVRAYAGLDTPLPPTNVHGTITDDALGITFTWEAPKGGANGGYIDLDDLTYDIYSQPSVGNAVKLGTAEDMTYTYTTAAGRQAAYHVGPVAVNRMGRSTGGEFMYETLGTPYATPMIEEFATTAFTYSKWYYSTNGEYSGSQIDNVSNLNGLGYGDPLFKEGGMMAVNLGGAHTRYQLNAPKVSTKDITKGSVCIRYWDFPQSGTLELWARSNADQEYKKIAEKTPNRGMGTWIDWNVNLPAEYCKMPWIQVNVRGTMGNGESVIMDNYQVLQDIDNDFKVTSLDGPVASIVGETASFATVIANSGNEAGTTTLTVDLLGDGEVIATDRITTGRTLSGDTFERNTNFEMLVGYLKYDKLQVRATVSDDDNAANNEMTVDFVLDDHQLPIVEDLVASRDGQDVVLTWSTPDTTYGSPEMCEVLPSFTLSDHLGIWTNIDMDEQYQFAIDRYRFDGDDQPSGWVVWNAQEMGTMREPRLNAHSGKQTLLARSCSYTEGADTPARSNDWLISPEVVGGTKVSFWYNTLSSSYTETVELWYSTTDTNLTLDNVEFDAKNNPIKMGSFQKLRNFSKSGAEEWEYCEYTLPEDAKYFAFVYSSIGQFGAMLDDIVFTPAQLYNYDVDHYYVIRKVGSHNAEVAASDVKDLTYRDEAQDALSAKYWVQSVVVNEGKEYRSPNSNIVTVEGSAVSGLDSARAVVAGKGFIIVKGFEGETIDLYDAEGRHTESVKIVSDRQSVAAAAGVTMVKIGDKIHKVIVK